MGHPYHADPGISHGIDELLGELGYAVLERTSHLPREVQDGAAAADSADGGEWTAVADARERVEEALGHPNLQVITLRSFGCGIDALAADAIHARMRSAGKPHAELKLDQIVDLAAIRIRLRSLDYAARRM